MEKFGEFLKSERIKRNLNQSEFGHKIGIIMTDISKIENGKKKFPFNNLVQLSNYLGVNLEKLKEYYVSDILVEEVKKYHCNNNVFMVAESKFNYLKKNNLLQK